MRTKAARYSTFFINTSLKGCISETGDDLIIVKYLK